jgi:hypothetical protein
MFDNFLLSWMELVELLNEMLLLNLIKLFFRDWNLLQRSECFAHFVCSGEGVVVGLFELLNLIFFTVFN